MTALPVATRPAVPQATAHQVVKFAGEPTYGGQGQAAGMTPGMRHPWLRSTMISIPSSPLPRGSHRGGRDLVMDGTAAGACIAIRQRKTIFYCDRSSRKLGFPTAQIFRATFRSRQRGHGWRRTS